MYSSVIPLKVLTLKVNCQAYLYRKVTDYDHVIAYARLTFVVISMESMINYLDARKFRHTKMHFDIMCRAVQARGWTIFYFIRPHIAYIMFSVFYIYHAVGRSDISQAF